MKKKNGFREKLKKVFRFSYLGIAFLIVATITIIYLIIGVDSSVDETLDWIRMGILMVGLILELTMKKPKRK